MQTLFWEHCFSMNKKEIYHEMSLGVITYSISFLGYTMHITASKTPGSPTENKAVNCSLLISPGITILLSLHWELLQWNIILVLFYWWIRLQILFTEGGIFLWWFNQLWGLESKTQHMFFIICSKLSKLVNGQENIPERDGRFETQ